jgi:hypothetical protein
MSTQRNFQNMLNEFLPNSLLRENFQKKDYFLQNVAKDNTWLGGDLIVPFRASQASTVRLGSLTPETEIGQSTNTRGKITNQPEAWGSLIFNERDLMEHGKISEQNLLKILPDEINDFTDYMKTVISLSWTNGAGLAGQLAGSAAGTGAIGAGGGQIVVDRPERLQVGQRAKLQASGVNGGVALDAYVGQVDLDTGAVVFVTTRYADPAVAGNQKDVSGFTNADAAHRAALFVDGGETAGNRFSSLKDLLLSAANGGAASIYGATKLASPYTQAIQHSGAGMNASNILSSIFDAFVKMKNRGAPGANKVLMGYKGWAAIMKQLESQKGGFRQASDVKASVYGWDEVEISGPGGKLTVVATQEMDDNFMPILDLSALKIYSNGFFKKRSSPEGHEYHVIRGTQGYQYIVDICFFGDMVLERPNRCGIIHSIDPTAL